ncbi:recombinase family protein [Microbacterium sp. LWS13-1.2]|uniref:Recombinase family protein n=1 Tax=Microbacterium sp. LWS13-1.2 TaxID=3135264 RepID=A0AAU6S7J1_9MICO
MTARRIGMGRVSTQDQHPESQKDALEAAKCDRVYIEKFTGTKAERPVWSMVRDEVLRTGDTLVITRLDRLGRSTKDLLQIAADLEARGINLEATEQKIDTTTPEGRLFFTMVAAFAEFEHSMMRARTMDGLAAARARGRKGGRKAKLSPQKVADIRRRAGDGESITDLAEYFGVSRPTIYRALDTTQDRPEKEVQSDSLFDA